MVSIPISAAAAASFGPAPRSEAMLASSTLGRVAERSRSRSPSVAEAKPNGGAGASAVGSRVGAVAWLISVQGYGGAGPESPRAGRLTAEVEARLRDPEIPAGERIVYRGAIGGEPVGSGEQVIQRLERDGQAYYLQHLEIAIRAQAHYRVETMFRRRRGAIVCDDYRAETRDGDQLVAIEEGHFRGVRGLAWGGELEHFPGDLTPLLGCAVALRGLELERGARRSLS